MGQPKSARWRLILPFFSILCLHGVSIFLFTRGFLLTRTELPHSSNCSDVFQSPCSPPPGSNATAGCWTSHAVDRIVIIVFDALRFDFVAPSTFFPEKKPWMDKLKIMQKLAADPGSFSRIFKAIADPPTTSLQRLKGLTTGGLPTFIDVGNSFGAPAIVEDNLIQQLVKNGKRVVMMGDDTWLQLFPHHFDKSYPYPSFNVKDLDTVDNGCIEHLLPSLSEPNWDVLIAHFLGVDHAGHIFGVDTTPMIQKLEQYNNILETVIEVLDSQSGPGGLHENTILLVMGDHGQTLNGDHGGGSPEEVETSIFAKSFRRLPSIPTELDISSCGLNMDGEDICISTIEQLDFAATIAALLGVPFPFGSIGRVNSQLYALGAGTWSLEGAGVENGGNHVYQEQWLHHYANVLCINAWQVKRYIDVYSASSVIGFPSEDLVHVADMYSKAQQNWSNFEEDSSPCSGVSCNRSFLALNAQLDAYFKFLSGVIDLARSKWTEFDMKLMSLGLSLLFISLLMQLIAIKRVNHFNGSSLLSSWHTLDSTAQLLSLFVVVIRASSFLSNSYILEEGKVAMYFLGTLWVLELHKSFTKKKLIPEAAFSMLLVSALRVIMESGLSKQGSNFVDLSWLLGSIKNYPIWDYFCLLASILAMIFLVSVLLKFIARRCWGWFQKYHMMGTSFCHVLVAVYWLMESKLHGLTVINDCIGRDFIPRSVYIIGCAQVISLSIGQFFHGRMILDHREDLTAKAVSMLSAWSPTIILLAGKQGALVGVAALAGAWSIMRLENLRLDDNVGDLNSASFYSLPVTQWSLLAVCLFFCTGHWCAFDGLRYSAAFIGFDKFNLIRQAILLAVDTFGFSHILPVFGLPLLVSHRALNYNQNQTNTIFSQLSQVYLMYGFITATATTFTVLCVTLHRRHLMVWGLFAPKFVFDAVGLILTDLLICASAIYYIYSREGTAARDEKKQTKQH